MNKKTKKHIVTISFVKINHILPYSVSSNQLSSCAHVCAKLDVCVRVNVCAKLLRRKITPVIER